MPPQPEPGPKTEPVPAALQGKGLDGATPQGLTLSGPSESGDVQSRGDGTAGADESTGNGRQAGGSGGGGSRRERRAAAREEAKKNKKGARR